MLFEIQNFLQLQAGIFQKIRMHFAEIEHDLWRALFHESLAGEIEFFQRAGLGFAGGCPKFSPQDADEQIAFSHQRVDPLLRTANAGRGVGLPTEGLQIKAMFLRQRSQAENFLAGFVAFEFHITGRSDEDFE
ncbi:MAG: hypothetical protein ONB46_16030 [candidate division KSB1 bacterium]|nr:hypothetical protein [candidate division KSB1 bacterium]MDZ7366861.1 hypothetical protein [candidate division KSB1 bacterium]MDZ7405132.1 hypothetical protein [candidate division KSB1 bacterium]